jgi:hypothetical protein
VAQRGTSVTGPYAIIEEIQTDPGGEYGGRMKNKITAPGLGQF